MKWPRAMYCPSLVQLAAQMRDDTRVFSTVEISFDQKPTGGGIWRERREKRERSIGINNILPVVR